MPISPYFGVRVQVQWNAEHTEGTYMINIVCSCGSEEYATYEGQLVQEPTKTVLELKCTPAGHSLGVFDSVDELDVIVQRVIAAKKAEIEAAEGAELLGPPKVMQKPSGVN